MRSSHGLTCGRLARRPREAARPATENERVGIDDAEAVAEEPRSAVARELGVDLVEHRADLRLRERLDDRGAGGVVGPALRIEVVGDRRLQRVRAPHQPLVGLGALGRGERRQQRRAGMAVGQVQADRGGLVEDERRAGRPRTSSSTRTGIRPFGLSARYSADLCADCARSTNFSVKGAPISSRTMWTMRLALPGKVVKLEHESSVSASRGKARFSPSPGAAGRYWSGARSR